MQAPVFPFWDQLPFCPWDTMTVLCQSLVPCPHLGSYATEVNPRDLSLAPMQ